MATKTKLQIAPVSGRIGARVSGVDLSGKVTKATKTKLCAALDEHQVIFFPGQKLTPVQQKEATKIFGPLLPSGTFFDGKQQTLRAKRGCPPMAKMSDSELAAATLPKRRGSSHTGVIRSTVATRLVFSNRYTPASSDVSGPISTLSSPAASFDRGATRSARSPGPTLAAQPPVLAQPVSRKFLLNIAMAPNCSETVLV